MPKIASIRSYSKSCKAVLLRAHAVACVALKPYFSHFSRKDFTAPQLFALLVLRSMLKSDFRGVSQFINDFPVVKSWLGLKRAPHYSTLCRAAQRLTKQFPALFDQLLVEAYVDGFF